MMIRPALLTDHELLSNIAFSAKRYWRYPEHYYTLWRDELRITGNYISDHIVFVYEADNTIAGFYSLVELQGEKAAGAIVIEPGLWLDHMFLAPQYIGNGIGRLLFTHCIATETFADYGCLNILADPFAAGFYNKMGCRFIKDMESTIPGRSTPLMQYCTTKKI